MNTQKKNKKAYLIILDGYGIGKHDKGDAIYHAKTPFFDALFQKNPHLLLKTDGESVGLPSFQVGGSEVGHITIGSGRAVKHLLTKINDQIDSEEFFTNTKLIQLFEKAQKNNSRIHFTGMLSDGGIHSFQAHLYGLLKMAKQYEIENIFLHLFTDGRDVSERSIFQYFNNLDTNTTQIFSENSPVSLATLSGRFYAMDRDNNWDRIEKITDLMIAGEKNPEESELDVSHVVNNFYQSSSESDYYIPPALFDADGQIQEGDVVINFNYRSDRSRQISQKIVEKISPENYGIFGPYCDGAQEIFNFGTNKIQNTLGEVLEKNNKTQLRISETEKFNHVTFFFSGEQKAEFSGEKRILVDSPKCKSYREKPEMSAREQTQELKNFLDSCTSPLAEGGLGGVPDFIVQNYANADLVGHSGDFEAAKISAEVLDECLSEIVPFAQSKGYQVLITADHGNADEMFLENGEQNAAHSKNLVPFIAVDSSAQILREKGTLQDIAPTILAYLGLPIPKEMTGENVFV
jgi:2,3-bisphosphoglycerate-independent phosphoglycerate mutase